MADLDQIEHALTEARDALRDFWEQGEGAVCFIALRLADDALADYRGLKIGDGAEDKRLTALVAEVVRLRAPLDAAPSP